MVASGRHRRGNQPGPLQPIASRYRVGLDAWCQQRGIPIMAYSPIEQGRLLHHVALKTIGDRHDATPAQVALAWVIAHDGVTAIPRASHSDHVRENRAAANVHLSHEDLALLDGAFPPPTSKRPLEVL